MIQTENSPTGKRRDKTAEVRRGPLGDARPEATEVDPRTSGGQPPEKVEDRPVVGTTTPEKYPDR